MFQAVVGYTGYTVQSHLQDINTHVYHCIFVHMNIHDYIYTHVYAYLHASTCMIYSLAVLPYAFKGKVHCSYDKTTKTADRIFSVEHCSAVLH